MPVLAAPEPSRDNTKPGARASPPNISKAYSMVLSFSPGQTHATQPDRRTSRRTHQATGTFQTTGRNQGGTANSSPTPQRYGECARCRAVKLVHRPSCAMLKRGTCRVIPKEIPIRGRKYAVCCNAVRQEAALLAPRALVLIPGDSTPAPGPDSRHSPWSVGSRLWRRGLGEVYVGPRYAAAERRRSKVMPKCLPAIRIVSPAFSKRRKVMQC